MSGKLPDIVSTELTSTEVLNTEGEITKAAAEDDTDTEADAETTTTASP
ncbi:MAG TPA: hypothetical protein VHM28_09320 [Anaerolineales bacterium]|jgi:hypothetical protein|nr:hypothetical protein [Anaerolineales bacterium]